MDEYPSTTEDLGKGLEESMIGFKLCSDGSLRFVNRTTNTAHALALLAFARVAVDLEMAKITAASLSPVLATKIAA